MSNTNIRFNRSIKTDFYVTLKNRVNTYFKEKNISKFGNATMVTKSVFMLTMYFTPLILMLTGVITGFWPIFFTFVFMGIFKAGIGLSIMHDAIHGSYSKKGRWNKIMSLSMNLIGGNNEIWRISHNVLHHTYTNIHKSDEDIKTPPFLRFSPHEKRRGIHRFQHIYVWFFYSLATLMWVTSKDFVFLARYKKNGVVKPKEYRKTLTNVILWKVIYYAYILVLPMILLPISPWLTLLGFIAMHMVAGLTLSMIFQTAHIMPNCEYPLPDENGVIDNNWAIHQLATTLNFAPKNKLLTWYCGCLNYQVEHHLFANVSHVHYPKLAEIVKETAREYEVPYNSIDSFWGAIGAHYRMLRDLGKMDSFPAKPMKLPKAAA